MSHPAWVCGLKQMLTVDRNSLDCHTLRGCVDWNLPPTLKRLLGLVTPCVGVWIETANAKSRCARAKVTPCVGVWIETRPPSCWQKNWKRHTLRGCVDWNVRVLSRTMKTRVTPCVGVWIETSQIDPIKTFDLVTPCVGVWIETV